ncbi:MAG: hypothetical protein ACHQUC_06490 [Chlamydiales bacterium]
MRSVTVLTVLFAQLLLTSCAGFGIVATNDPLVKLNDAEYLFMNYDRPLPAEKLIFEAMDIYQKENNSRGLGNAHREYGEFLLSHSVTKWEKYYRNNGFRDKTITFENRVAKSSEYFEKALEFYLKSEKKPLEAEQFDDLSNLYFNIGWTYFRLHDLNNSCKFYNKSLEANTENIHRNPTAKPQVSSNFGSFSDMIASEKKRANCE